MWEKDYEAFVHDIGVRSIQSKQQEIKDDGLALNERSHELTTLLHVIKLLLVIIVVVIISRLVVIICK
jgi:flagellar biosynthesis/type III secretory pathway M-ring protein FliF/YscJ